MQKFKVDNCGRYTKIKKYDDDDDDDDDEFNDIVVDDDDDVHLAGQAASLHAMKELFGRACKIFSFFSTQFFSLLSHLSITEHFCADV